MIFCKNCGKQLPDDAAFCESCGTPVGNAQQPVNPTAMPPVDDAADANSNKAMGILAYIGILVLIPLFAAKQSKFARYHVGQGLTALAVEVAYGIAVAILNAIVGAIFRPTLTWLGYVPHPVASFVGVVLNLGYIFFLVISILGIVNAAKGEKKELPVIGKIDFISKHFQ